MATLAESFLADLEDLSEEEEEEDLQQQEEGERNEEVRQICAAKRLPTLYTPA